MEKILNEVSHLEQKLGYAPVVACMGLAFKPNIDDLRESPALQVFQRLITEGLKPLAVEPNLKMHPSLILTSWEEAVEIADLLVYLVAHREFKAPDVKGKIIDFCGVMQS